MLSFKTVAIILTGWIILSFATGYLALDRGDLKCFKAKHWKFGEYHTWYSIGALDFKYRTLDFDCSAEEKFNPKTQTIREDGIYTSVVPKVDNSTNTIDTNADGTNP